MICRSFAEATPFLDKLVKLDRDCFGEACWDVSTWELMFQNSHLSLILLQEKSYLLGFLSFIQLDNEAELLKMAVAPQSRRVGLGSRLIRELCDLALKQGISSIFLEVRHNNRAAIELYLQQGFLKQGVRKNYYHSPQADAWLFKREFS